MGEQWAPGGADEGKWWHHGNSDGLEAKPEAAQARGASLRRMLADEAKARGVRTVLLVAHGGILKLAFETESFANAEFRYFELSAEGDILAV